MKTERGLSRSALAALAGLSVLMASADGKRLTALKDGTAFSLDDVPGEIVVERSKDAPLRFSLEENGTTGYRWNVEWNDVECSVVQDRRAPDTAVGRCGAPGLLNVTVVSKTYTPARVELRYARPWETNVPPAKALKVIVYTVGEAKSPLYPKSEPALPEAGEGDGREVLLRHEQLRSRSEGPVALAGGDRLARSPSRGPLDAEGQGLRRRQCGPPGRLLLRHGVFVYNTHRHENASDIRHVMPGPARLRASPRRRSP